MLQASVIWLAIVLTASVYYIAGLTGGFTVVATPPQGEISTAMIDQHLDGENKDVERQ